MSRTFQRAIIRQAAREGLPVWAWLLATYYRETTNA
jgi:hypothetical protein